MVSRYAEGIQDRLPALAEEIVGLKPDVIVAAAVNAAVPARAATSAIPIVCPALADAVHLGLIASEAPAGDNVTGIEPYVAGLPAKQMEFAREIAPGATRIGLLTNLQDPKAPPQRQELVSAAKPWNWRSRRRTSTILMRSSVQWRRWQVRELMSSSCCRPGCC